MILSSVHAISDTEAPDRAVSGCLTPSCGFAAVNLLRDFAQILLLVHGLPVALTPMC